jgi:adenylate cyclase
MTRPAPAAALEIIEWLVGDECQHGTPLTLAEQLGNKLRQSGAQVDRLNFHLRTLHPEIRAHRVGWVPGSEATEIVFEHGSNHGPGVVANVLLRVMSHREWARERLDAAEAASAPFYQGFAAEGLVEMVFAPLENADGTVSAVSLGTRRATGFNDDEIRLFERILKPLRTVLELKTLRTIGETLLETYIGPGTGRRILAGHIRRGDMQLVDAALMFCDLRGFTQLSNRVANTRVIELLNCYFDQIVPAIDAEGGEVLKFMGDGLLAFFHRESGPNEACAAALRAAQSGLARLAMVQQPDAELHAGMALHHGIVGYGNVGSGRRLDFTVIGRDVNLTSRIETVCSLTGKPILMSGRFAEHLDHPATVSIGRHSLKGFDEPVELFSWEGSDSNTPPEDGVPQP